MKEKTISNKKKTGSYYTPEVLSDFIVKNTINNNVINKLLEPSCGDGSFLKSIYKLKEKYVNNITAVEINNKEYKILKEKFKNKDNIKIINDDFINFYVNENNKYDLIVGNPPYIRYHYLSESQKEIQNKILIQNKLKENKLINIWFTFMLSCTNLLSDNGTLAFVLPYELLQINYAKELRLFLSKNFAHITIITFNNIVFKDIEQDVIVFIGEKNTSTNNSKIRVVEVDNLDCLSTLKLNDYKFKELKLDDDKWTKYFSLINDHNEIINNIKNDNRFIKINETCKINIGITTGCNDYFGISKEIENKYKLTKVLIPLISKSNQINGIFYTKNDLKNNINKNNKSQLLNFNNVELTNNYNEYIKYGESLGVQNRYKCSIRKRWYDVPSIWIPDVFFLRRIGKIPKFIINSCNAVSTDSLNRLKFNDNINKVDVVLAYYNSISLLFTELNGRSFGGGVLEVLPKELGNVYIPDISNMSEDIKNKLINNLDTLIRSGDSIENIINIMDQEILQNYLKISVSDCEKFNKLWLLLKNKRVGK